MKKITLLLILISCLSLSAQDYEFSFSNETYQDLDNPILLNEDGIWEYPHYEIPIGFDFTITNFTSDTIYSVESGLAGYLSLASDAAINIPLIVPIGQDIKDRGDSSTGSLSPISYQLEGQTGNHILKIEWKNVGFFGDQTGNDYMNLQVWLYENSNIIEYHYGDNEVNNPISYDYSSGPSVVLFPLVNISNSNFIEDGYVLTGSTSSPSLSVVNNNNPPTSINLNGDIPEGMVYRFTPSNLATESKLKELIAVYPNPANDVIHVKNLKDDTYKFNIYDMLGKLVHTSNHHKIDVSGLSQGVYLLNIQSQKDSFSIKIIKS